MPPPATPVSPVTPALVAPAPSPQLSLSLSSILSYEQTLCESSISSEGDDSQRDPDFKPAGAGVQVNLDEEEDQLVDDDEELVPVTRELFLPNLFDSANLLSHPRSHPAGSTSHPLLHGLSHSQCLANRGVHHGECQLC